jgi:hypothetical protein
MKRNNANLKTRSKMPGCLFFAWLLALSASAEMRLVPREDSGKTAGRRMGIGSFLVGESTNDFAVVDIFFYTQDENGQKTPCYIRDMNMRPDYMDRGLSHTEIVGIREQRRFDVRASMGLAGSDEPIGVSGARFAAVPVDYEGKSFSLFVKGTTYRLTLYPPFMLGEEGKKSSLQMARARLEIPETLEKGKRYVVDWMLTEHVEEKPPKPIVYEIKGVVEGAMLKNRHPHMSAWYFTTRGFHYDPMEGVDEDGRFIFESGELGRPLAIYDKIGHTFSALCIVNEARDLPLVLPQDADAVFDKTSFVETRLHIPEGFRHERDSLVIGAYREDYKEIALALDAISTEGEPVGKSIMANGQMPGMAHTSVLMLTPGTYTARIYECGARLDNPRDTENNLQLRAEIKMTVERDGKVNDFTFPVGGKK